MFTSFLVLVLASSSAAVYAKPVARQTTPQEWCTLLTSASVAFDNNSNFTLAAYNTTGNTDTGVPLGVAGHSTDPGATLPVLSVWDTTEGIPIPTFSLVNGGLIGSVDSEQAVGISVSEGSEIEFFPETTSEVSAAQIWCGLYDTSAEGGGPGYPSLTVNEDGDSFALCPVGNGQISIVWQPTADNDFGYNVDDCYSVDVLVIQPF